MGGDLGLRSSLPAAVNSLQRFPNLHLILVGAAAQIQSALGTAPARLTIVDAEQVVEMNDRPSAALRHKTRSSMRIALDLLAAREVDAVVSGGNTGALMAMSLIVLRNIPGIERPAMCTALPTKTGHCLLLDLGANVDCDAEQLQQFALMGAALAASDGIENPRVALLNIGAESAKGNEQVKRAHDIFSADTRINYSGFVEGDSLFDGIADVVVCDGFAGNIALKTCEGTAKLIAEKMRKQFSRNIFTRAAGAVAMPVLKALYLDLDPQQYNGAVLLGVRGVVIKSHGNSSSAGFENAIVRAITAVEKDLSGLIERRLSHN
ncbi:MAG: phosphate acyltransferase PlsX [Verrucomicrobiaceae bacterium]|nr:phosphate acyltransferase PlsX [Verrucomicrobiaceae bacterium]